VAGAGVSADPARYRTPVAVGLTIALIAILALVLTGTFDGSAAPVRAGHRPVCHAHHHHHHHHCRDRLRR
jgi:hypothetical protein